MTNLDSVKSREITLLTKVRLVKAMVFPVVKTVIVSDSTCKPFPSSPPGTAGTVAEMNLHLKKSADFFEDLCRNTFKKPLSGSIPLITFLLVSSRSHPGPRGHRWHRSGVPTRPGTPGNSSPPVHLLSVPLSK